MKLNKKIAAFFAMFAVLVTMVTVTPYGVLGEAHAERISLTPGGTAFGVKFFTKGVIVVGITDVEVHDGLKSPARDSGIIVGDVITSIDGGEVNTVEHLGRLFSQSGGKPTTLSITRDDKDFSVVVTPVKSTDGSYKSGLWVRDSTAGIGTITYIDAKTGNFGGLGHGICDGDTGKVMPILRGVVVDVKITGIVKGKINEPGELKGEFSNTQCGSINKNTINGVFGKLEKPCITDLKPIEIGFRSEVKPGKAYIYTALDDEKPHMYEINIVKVYNNGEKTKNLLIKVTDKALIAKTGGIVQGMSGSPILQNGRLIGAVTHVMINDPTSGYGIFIENMLAENK